MKNRVKVTIAGREYTVVAEEEIDYMAQVAGFVDQEIQKVSRGLRPLDAATVAALNITDVLYKERQSTESLRQQLKEALDEVESLNRQLRQNRQQKRK